MTGKVCVCCGNVFFEDEKGKPGRKKQYCSAECHEKASIERRKVYGAEYRAKKKQEKESQKKSESLNEFNTKAMAAGLTYGKYTEMLMIQEMQRKRCKNGQQKNVHKEDNRQRSVS